MPYLPRWQNQEAVMTQFRFSFPLPDSVSGKFQIFCAQRGELSRFGVEDP